MAARDFLNCTERSTVVCQGVGVRLIEIGGYTGLLIE